MCQEWNDGTSKTPSGRIAGGETDQRESNQKGRDQADDGKGSAVVVQWSAKITTVLLKCEPLQEWPDPPDEIQEGREEGGVDNAFLDVSNALSKV